MAIHIMPARFSRSSRLSCLFRCLFRIPLHARQIHAGRFAERRPQIAGFLETRRNRLDREIASIDTVQLPGAQSAVIPIAPEMLPSRALDVEQLAMAGGIDATPIARRAPRRWWLGFVK